ncbi:MAG TPA: A/G-specific adenine glycosylase [Roseiflexaceae bacterium]|nr:A/G-specific adenine glycosylase [Roseiflexaceae bacterium]
MINHVPRADEQLRDLPAIQPLLRGWFASHGRDLPWRRTRDPYRVLVSEVMLQQTQVDRVIPKYLAFLELFPSAEALAQAPTAEVIRAWAGLGYNRRAVNLQRTAQAVVEQFGGRFPQDVAELRQLPGIGPYTAGAVACFAFEQDVAFMDTNIRRVVQRVFVGPEPAPEARLQALAASAVPAGHGWEWNQAIMELGALVCTASAPACWRCPLREHCRDYAARRQTDEQSLLLPPAMPAPRPQKRVAERREAPFVGSNRYYRGRIVDALRQLPPHSPLALVELGQRIKPDFGEADLPWLRGLVDALARDGLIAVEGEAARLP